MAELIWECLIISMVVLFGINIGLAIGLTEFHKKKAIAISAVYGAIILILSILTNFLNFQLYNIANTYIPEILGIIGIIIFLNGIYAIIKWRNTKKEYYSFLQAGIPSICYFTGFGSVSVLLSKEITISFLEFSIFIAIATVLVLIVFYLFSKILRNAERSYPVLLGNFMILNGFYFLTSAAFIPTIENLSSVQMSPLSISSMSSLIFLVMAGLGVFLIGSYLKTEGITSLKDIYQGINLFNKTKKI